MTIGYIKGGSNRINMPLLRKHGIMAQYYVSCGTFAVEVGASEYSTRSFLCCFRKQHQKIK